MALSTPINLTATTLGEDKVNNGSFTLTTYWTYGQDGGGWSRDATNNEADCDGSQSTGVDLTQDISAVATERYLLQYTIKNYVAGTVTPQIGGVDGIAKGANGAGETYITATGTGNLKFQADSTFNGTIDSVSVKKVLFPDGDTIRLTWTNRDSYDSVLVERNDGSGFVDLIELGGNEESYDDTDVTANIFYTYRVYVIGTGEDPEDGYSNTDSAACWRDNITDETVVSESVSDYATSVDVSDTITDTMYVSDFVIDAKDIITNYVYYLGTAAGGIYEYGGFYKSDAGTAITTRWESKDTDFADQSIENSDKFKTVEFVRLHYIDKSAGARISIKVSTDGGASWTTKTKSIGTGNSKGKTKDFHFIITGQIFRFAIESISVTDDFQWVGLEVFYNPGGDFFEV